MAFWGVELKPGNPYRHRYDEARGRLHVSQATLGSGKSTQKSVSVQCSVGANRPVLLCSLLPEKTESCPLNLEFEEEDVVVFEVLGSRSVHLTGFFLGPSGDFDHHEDDSDSYGEDIAETETDQSSDYDSEDEYEDDFIDDDDDIEMFPSPPRRNCGVTIEEIVDDEKPANKTGAITCVKKKDQYSDSERSDNSQKQIVKSSGIPVLESEDEDGFPVSATSKRKFVLESAGSKSKLDKSTAEDGIKEKTTDDSSQGVCLKRKIDAIKDAEYHRGGNQLSDSFTPSDDMAAENGGKSKKKKKEKVKNGKILQSEEPASGEESNKDHKSDELNNFRTDAAKEKLVDKDQDLPISDEPKQRLPNNMEVKDLTAPLDTAPESSGKLKKKKKSKTKDKTDQSKVGPSAEMDDKACCDKGSDTPNSKDAAVETMEQDPSTKDQQLNSNPLDEKSLDENVSPADVGGQSEGKKKKKKKKKSSQTNQGNPDGSLEESEVVKGGVKNMLVENNNDHQAQPRLSKPRTFSNGLVIEELSMGRPDGRRASPGNKVSVHYIGKLKKNGEIFDSNIGRRPFKFRLGIGQVIKGWDVGVAGMRVGDKRRLTIPPSMGYGSQGAGKIPPNAWLVFDVELVDVQ